MILVAFSMTWLLVSTRPPALSTMPVPAACSLLYCSVVLMMTRLGSTFFRTAASLALVPGGVLGMIGTGLLLGNGAAGTALMLGAGAAEALDVGWYSATTVPAPRAPAASATAR